MAISDILSRRVRARPDEDDDDVYSNESGSSGEVSDAESDAVSDDDDSQSQDLDESEDMEADEDNADDDEKEEEEETSSADDNNLQTSLNNISFGALAKAQASLGRQRRKEKQGTKPMSESITTASPLDGIRSRIRSAREQKHQQNTENKTDGSKEPNETKMKASRTSKHAPMVQSSKHAVSRKRMVIEPPAAPKARDPRFDAAVMGHSGAGKRPSESSSKAYAFLDEYRASELKELKAQLGKTKDAKQKEALKREIRSTTDRMRAMENKKREAEIRAEHKKKEKALLREGKKSTPFYLKKSDLKKQVLVKKYEEMGSRDRAKALERRRKKTAGKERRNMPFQRRGLEGDHDGPEGGQGGKRRRLV